MADLHQFLNIAGDLMNYVFNWKIGPLCHSGESPPYEESNKY